MDFETYAVKFKAEAVSAGKSDFYISECLKYAERLFFNGCPVIYTPKHLASLVGYDFQYLNKAYYGIEKHYKIYEIPKRNGGKRVISEPLPSLKEIQRWILDNILYVHKVHPYAKAYVPSKKLRENMRFHRKQKKVLALDINDFFGSITRSDVFNLFYSWGYGRELSNMLSQLLCLNDSLPQGAPTSPHISNLYMRSFDGWIANFCKQKNGSLRYTRYADDMTFSGDFDHHEVIEFVKSTLPGNLRLNDNKTKVMLSHQRQIVTGCIVNEKLQLPKEERKDLRQQVYYIWKFGLDNHLIHIKEKRKNYLKHLLGRVTYASYLCPSDSDFKEYRQFLFELYKKEEGAEYSNEILNNTMLF